MTLGIGLAAFLLRRFVSGAPFWGFMPLVVGVLMPSRITVGIDGVLVRWLGYRSFYSMHELVSVEPEADQSLRLHLRSGKSAVIYTSAPTKYSEPALTREHRDAVVARIREAQRIHASGGAADATGLVACGTKSVSEWLSTLKRLAGEPGYRIAALRPEDLVRVVEDPAAPEDARAGAAVVLRAMDDSDAADRVRVATEATASPKLRVALNAATSGSEEMLEHALADLSEGKSQSSRA